MIYLGTFLLTNKETNEAITGDGVIFQMSLSLTVLSVSIGLSKFLIKGPLTLVNDGNICYFICTFILFGGSVLASLLWKVISLPMVVPPVCLGREGNCVYSVAIAVLSLTFPHLLLVIVNIFSVLICTGLIRAWRTS